MVPIPPRKLMSFFLFFSSFFFFFFVFPLLWRHSSLFSMCVSYCRHKGLAPGHQEGSQCLWEEKFIWLLGGVGGGALHIRTEWPLVFQVVVATCMHPYKIESLQLVSSYSWQVDSTIFILISSLPFRLHVLAGVLPGGVDSTDNTLVTQWEETYIKNMRYAAQRFQEVMQKVQFSVRVYFN